MDDSLFFRDRLAVVSSKARMSQNEDTSSSIVFFSCTARRLSVLYHNYADIHIRLDHLC